MNATIVEPDIEQLVETDALTAVYQPILDLDSRQVVAYEALARGPYGTPWESPDLLFRAAAEQGMTARLDWACRSVAVRGALEARLGRATRLFVNVEPSTLLAPRPKRYDALAAAAADQLSIVVEVTERSIVDDPASLIAALGRIRAAGMGVAIDDLGAVRDSLALLPFVAPDVTKLDLRLIQDRTDPDVAAIASAVRADAERRGSWILAEGIETEQHLDQALVLGARLGQGWLFGRPGPLHAMPEQNRRRQSDGIVQTIQAPAPPPTPWELVAHWEQRRTATKRLLIPMSDHIEQSSSPGQSRVVLSAFQDAIHFTDNTRHRYEALAQQCNLVGAIAHGIGHSPGQGIRGGSLPIGHPLADEWTVTAVGAHEAAALIARQRSDTGADGDRIFEYVITHDRETVVSAARSLMQYLDPI